jgi:hypothetical protein
MQNTKFLVKLTRVGAHGPQYLLEIGKKAIKTTSERKLALLMESTPLRMRSTASRVPDVLAS